MATIRTARASVLAAALLVVACSGGPGPGAGEDQGAPPDGDGRASAGGAPADAAPDADAGAQEPPADGAVRVQGCEPRSLLPAAVDRFCGLGIARALYTPLVQEPTGDGPATWGPAADHAMARRISSQDAVTWRIELDPDWVFHDGQPVRAEHFVDAWNFAAHGPNAQPLGFLFEPIAGYTDVTCPQVDCEPETDRLAGLRVVDELTIEVELREPDRLLPQRLAHVAFAPLPPQALEDPSAFEEAPVGNGPLRLEGGWRHNEGLSLRPHEGYGGTPAGATAVEVVLFEDLAAAWDALEAGGLDVVTAVPPGRRDAARSRYARMRVDGDRLDLLVLPAHRRRPGDEELVAALSRAIDREAVIDEHLQGLARPVRGLVPPVVSDTADRCGATCDFDPDAARELLGQVGLPDEGLELWIDQDAGLGWGRAVAEQWRTHLRLGPDQLRLRVLSHTSWVSHVRDRRVGGLHPLGWTMDVASPLPYLEELHLPGGLFAFDGYDEPGATAAVARARAAPNELLARVSWRAAEARLLEAGRAVPLWTRQHEAYYDPGVVEEVRLGPRGELRLAELRPAGDQRASDQQPSD